MCLMAPAGITWGGGAGGLALPTHETPQTPPPAQTHLLLRGRTLTATRTFAIPRPPPKPGELAQPQHHQRPPQTLPQPGPGPSAPRASPGWPRPCARRGGACELPPILSPVGDDVVPLSPAHEPQETASPQRPPPPGRGGANGASANPEPPGMERVRLGLSYWQLALVLRLLDQVGGCQVNPLNFGERLTVYKATCQILLFAASARAVNSVVKF